LISGEGEGGGGQDKETVLKKAEERWENEETEKLKLNT
jgi:hypothetical protein